MRPHRCPTRRRTSFDDPYACHRRIPTIGEPKMHVGPGSRLPFANLKALRAQSSSRASQKNQESSRCRCLHPGSGGKGPFPTTGSPLNDSRAFTRRSLSGSRLPRLQDSQRKPAPVLQRLNRGHDFQHRMAHRGQTVTTVGLR